MGMTLVLPYLLPRATYQTNNTPIVTITAQLAKKTGAIKLFHGWRDSHSPPHLDSEHYQNKLDSSASLPVHPISSNWYNQQFLHMCKSDYVLLKSVLPLILVVRLIFSKKHRKQCVALSHLFSWMGTNRTIRKAMVHDEILISAVQSVYTTENKDSCYIDNRLFSCRLFSQIMLTWQHRAQS